MSKRVGPVAGPASEQILPTRLEASAGCAGPRGCGPSNGGAEWAAPPVGSVEEVAREAHGR